MTDAPINQTQAVPSADPLAMPANTEKAQAIADVEAAALRNPLIADAGVNPATRFKLLADKGFHVVCMAPAQKAKYVSQWSQPCCQIMSDSTGVLTYLATTYSKDDTKQPPRFKAGDTRPEATLPPTFKPYQNIGIVAGLDDVMALDFDWPKNMEVPRPDVKDEAAVFSFCYSHPSFKVLFDHYTEAHGADEASKWFQGGIIQLTTSHGFQFIGRMLDGGPMRNSSGLLVRPHGPALADGTQPTAQLDVRYHGGMIMAPGSIVGCKRDASGTVVREVRMYEIISGHHLHVRDLEYFPLDMAQWCVEQGGGCAGAQNSSGNSKARTDVSGPEWMQNKPAHGAAAAGAAPIVGAADTNRGRRDPATVMGMYQSIVAQSALDNAATLAALTAGDPPHVRAQIADENGALVVQDCAGYDGFRDMVLFPLVGGVAAKELSCAEGKKLFDDVSAMAQAHAGGVTLKNEELWAGELAAAQAKVGAGQPVMGCKRIEKLAQASGWVAPLSQLVVDAQAADAAAQIATVPAPASTNLWAGLAVGGDDGVVVDAAPTNTWPGGVQGVAKLPKQTLANYMEAILRQGFSAKMNTRMYQPFVRVPPHLATKYLPGGWHRMDEAVLRLVEKHTSGVDVSVAGSPGSIQMSETTVVRALKAIADEVQYDPAYDALKRLRETRYTGTSTHMTVGITHMGVEDTPLNREYFRMFFVGLVGRVFRRGTKFDLVLLLAGLQGQGKSSLGPAIAMALGSMDFFTEDLDVGAEAKLVNEQTEGVVVVELGEMSGKRKLEHDNVRKFVTKTKDKARPAYGRTSEERDRSFVMYGTSNDPDPLSDLNGNRRFMPVQTGTINVAALERDMPSILADAVEDYRTSFAHQPAKIELAPKWYALSTQAQLKATAAPIAVPYVENILNLSEGHIARITSQLGTRFKFIPTLDIARAMATQPGSSHLHEGSIKDAMLYLGWHKSRRRPTPGENPVMGFEQLLNAAEIAGETANIKAGLPEWSGDGQLQTIASTINGGGNYALPSPNPTQQAATAALNTGTQTGQTSGTETVQ